MSLDPLLIAGALVLGAILGSFLNALTFRYNTGLPLWRAMGGRSHCMRCNHELGAFDLVPVLSWVFLCGHCRYCRSPISPQYPLVEIAAALLSVGVAFYVYNTACYTLYNTPCCTFMYLFWMMVWMTILFLVVYDWRHMILPLEALALLTLLGFASLFFSYDAAYSVVLPDLWQLLAGPILALPLSLLSLISSGRWMGWGDGILALPLGWILGVSAGLSALMLSFWIGAAVGLVLVAVARLREPRGDSFKFGLKESPRGSRHLTLKSALPFGPFLALGAAIVFFTHLDLFTIIRW